MARGRKAESEWWRLVRWSNLVKAFQGLTRARMLLVIWEAFLGAILWISGSLLPWWGLAVGYAVAFLAHELFFMVWAERIARIPEADVYRVPGYVATLERWTGPVA